MNITQQDQIADDLRFSSRDAARTVTDHRTQASARSAFPVKSPSPQQLLRAIWGYEDFRAPQGDIVQTLLNRQDALIIMPTGGGKSICFQLPALLQTGLTIVVSPLVALMENQVQELRDRQLPAALLHSQLPKRDRLQTLQALDRGQLRLLYLSPETLLSPPIWEKLCQPHIVIDTLVLDEAHCLAQWGDSFRPAYFRLGAVRTALNQTQSGRIAVAAFTATADPQVQQTIERVLGLHQPRIFRQDPYRDNLELAVQTVYTPRGRRQQLLKFIQAHADQPGLVYVRTRADSTELANWLREAGYSTAAYHAGLSAQERRQIEADWLADRRQFVVSTNAFGMGINKPNLRWVVHFHLPLLLSEYVQEIGRAGRDGQPAQALALASEPTGWLDPSDRQRWQFFRSQTQTQQQTAHKLAQQLPRQGSVTAAIRQFPEAAVALSLLHRSGQLTWLDPFTYQLAPQPGSSANPTRVAPAPTHTIETYLKTHDCRWQFLLQAFGFESSGFRCGSCDRCQ
jgi:ATP-dependent DNA helicase RecQ